MGTQELVAKLAAIKVVSDALAQSEKAVKAALAGAGMGPGDRVHARVGDDSAGTVSMSSPKERFTVRDQDEFTRWVQKNRPEEIVPQVRKSFQDHVLRSAASTGEVPDGVELVVGSPSVSVRLTDEQRQVMTDALMGGRVDWAGLLAIEGGDV